MKDMRELNLLAQRNCDEVKCDFADLNRRDYILGFKDGYYRYQQKVLLEQPAPSRQEAKPTQEDWGQIFDDNFDCYADTKSQYVIPAMTKEKFISVAGAAASQQGEVERLKKGNPKQ
jgi:hypothetical protein